MSLGFSQFLPQALGHGRDCMLGGRVEMYISAGNHTMPTNTVTKVDVWAVQHASIYRHDWEFCHTTFKVTFDLVQASKKKNAKQN